MPKFNEQEKQIIKDRLYEEGEKLFCTYGLQKVTINDLTNSAAISHGAFYSFFKNKEQLFMEINMKKQMDVFKRLESLVAENKANHPHKLVKHVLMFLMREYFSDPLISSINDDVWDQLTRRVPKKTIENHNINDGLVVKMLSDAGVRFKFDIPVVVNIAHQIFLMASSNLSDDKSGEALEIIIDSVIEKIVES